MSRGVACPVDPSSQHAIAVGQAVAGHERERALRGGCELRGAAEPANRLENVLPDRHAVQRLLGLIDVEGRGNQRVFTRVTAGSHWEAPARRCHRGPASSGGRSPRPAQRSRRRSMNRYRSQRKQHRATSGHELRTLGELLLGIVEGDQYRRGSAVGRHGDDSRRRFLRIDDAIAGPGHPIGIRHLGERRRRAAGNRDFLQLTIRPERQPRPSAKGSALTGRS